MEAKSRRPVTGEHPVICAAASVLKDVGGPLKVKDIFRRCADRGDLPLSAHNTIRGRLSHHLFHARRDGRDPSVIKLPKRRGWMCPTEALRTTRITEAWLVSAHAPAFLIDLIREVGPADLADVMTERLDLDSLEWLLETLPFQAELRAALSGADTVTRQNTLRGA